MHLQAKGNAAFAAGDFDKAIEHFTAGIEVDANNHVLYSNRSAAQVLFYTPEFPNDDFLTQLT